MTGGHGRPKHAAQKSAELVGHLLHLTSALPVTTQTTSSTQMTAGLARAGSGAIHLSHGPLPFLPFVAAGMESCGNIYAEYCSEKASGIFRKTRFAKVVAKECFIASVVGGVAAVTEHFAHMALSSCVKVGGALVSAAAPIFAGMYIGAEIGHCVQRLLHKPQKTRTKPILSGKATGALLGLVSAGICLVTAPKIAIALPVIAATGFVAHLARKVVGFFF